MMLRTFPIKLIYTARPRGASPGCGVPRAPPSWLLDGKAQAVGALTALPSGCHEVAVQGGTARDEEGGDGIEFSRNLRLVRGKVASRKELSHRPCTSSIPAASTILLQRYRLVAHGPCSAPASEWLGPLARRCGRPRALVHAWSTPLQVVERTGDSRWERRGRCRSVSARRRR